jgi:hypothetical protein
MSMIQTCLEVCAKSSKDSILSTPWVMADMAHSSVFWGSSARIMIGRPTWLAPPSLGHRHRPTPPPMAPAPQPCPQRFRPDSGVLVSSSFFVFLDVLSHDGASTRHPRPDGAPPHRHRRRAKLPHVGRPSSIPMIRCVSDHTIMPLEEGRGEESIQKNKCPNRSPWRTDFTYHSRPLHRT